MADPFWRKNTIEHIEFMLECNRNGSDLVGVQIRQFSSSGETLMEYKTLIQMNELFLIRSILGPNCNNNCKDCIDCDKKNEHQLLPFELFFESTMGNDGRGKATFPYFVMIPNIYFGNEILTLLKFLDSFRSPKKLLLFSRNWSDPFKDKTIGIDFSCIEENQHLECPKWYCLIRQMGILCHIPGYENDKEKYFKGLPKVIQKYLLRPKPNCQQHKISFNNLSLYDESENEKKITRVGDYRKNLNQKMKGVEPSIQRITKSP